MSESDSLSLTDLYTQAIGLSRTPDDVKSEDIAIFYQDRAACYEAIGDSQRVIEDCTRAIDLRTTYIEAYSRRDRAYAKLEDFDKAMVDASRVDRSAQEASTIALSDLLEEKFKNPPNYQNRDNM